MHHVASTKQCHSTRLYIQWQSEMYLLGMALTCRRCTRYDTPRIPSESRKANDHCKSNHLVSSVIYLRHFHAKLPFSALFQQESIHFSVIYLRHIFSQVQHTSKKHNFMHFCIYILVYTIAYCNKMVYTICVRQMNRTLCLA